MARVLITLLGFCIFSFAGAPMSAAWDAATETDSKADQFLAITFSDEAGRAQATPYFAVAGAFPGMEPRRAEVTLTNNGTVAADYDISVLVTAESAGPAIADALKVSVVSLDNGRPMYRGPLRGLTLTSRTALEAGQSVTFVMSVVWPDGGAEDNLYQGKTLTFDLQGRARQSQTN